MIAAAAHVLGDDMAGVLARLGGPIGIEARAAPPSTKLLRASWASQGRVPVPGGFRGVDPSWIEAGLDGLPSQAREAVASGGGSPARVWLARWACARIVSLPQAVDGEVSSLASALCLPGPRLRDWLDRIGADQLAMALSAAGPEAMASGVRVAGERLAIAASRIDVPPRVGALGPVRAAIERCRGIALDDIAFARIGARAIAPYVARRALAREQTMLRLPRGLGLIVGAELANHAADPIERSPSWAALAVRDTTV
ncbi:MAG TPA: hypothetical protein VGO00_11655 [Kofleriaceae bacterium]|nr:hypothetical protein [Kofleriaceae bacterium]